MKSVVAAPPRGGPLAGSILSSLTPQPVPDDRWEGGFTWFPDSASSLGVWAPCSNQLQDLPIGDGAREALEQEPLGFVVREVCSTGLDVDFAARARAALDLALDPALSQETWYGTYGKALGLDQRYLAGGSPNFEWTTTDPSGGDTVSAQSALLGLQAIIGAHGFGTGVVHAGFPVAAVWQAMDLISQRGGRFTDAFGNLVLVHGITGPGGPDGAVDDDPSAPIGSEQWVYATGPVGLLLGDVQEWGTGSQVIDARTNQVATYAGRTAAVTFDDVLHVGIRVDYSL